MPGESPFGLTWGTCTSCEAERVRLSPTPPAAHPRDSLSAGNIRHVCIFPSLGCIRKPQKIKSLGREKLTPDVRDLVSEREENFLGQTGLVSPRLAILLLLPVGLSALLLLLGGAAGYCFLSKQKSVPPSALIMSYFPTDLRYPQVSNIFVSTTLSSGSWLKKNEVVKTYEKQLNLFMPHSKLQSPL